MSTMNLNLYNLVKGKSLSQCKCRYCNLKLIQTFHSEYNEKKIYFEKIIINYKIIYHSTCLCNDFSSPTKPMISSLKDSEKSSNFKKIISKVAWPADVCVATDWPRAGVVCTLRLTNNIIITSK